MTILLLPLTVFRVDYQLASGRPYSQLDELVLRAIAQKEARTIDELHQFFCLPKRLITESLITLAKVGWIAISNKGGGFKSTSSGNAVVNSPKKTLPNSIKLNPPGNDDIVMERVTGQLIRSDHITYELEHKLKEKDILDDAHIIKAEFLGNNLSQGQIHNLLLWDRTKWIYYIDTPKPYKEAWLMVNVNNGKITNLPDRWWNLLEDRLLEEAEKVAHENPELVNKIAESSFQKSIKDEKDEWDGTYSTPIELQDLLLTHRQHI